MVDYSPFFNTSSLKDVEYSNLSSSYETLRNHHPNQVIPRTPRKRFLLPFSGLLLVALLVVLVGNQTHIGDGDDKTSVSLSLSSSSSSSSSSSTSQSPFGISRGVKEGVSEKTFKLNSSDAVVFPWTNQMLSWQRTAFHFQPSHNWMNDPDGPLFYKGWYHLFYQWNPDAAVWGNITWGHAVSKDLIHWLYLPLAMVPTDWYDINGVWTGSATFLPNGNIVMIYTGSTHESVQVQNVAFPANLSDPLLLDWVKYSGNPVLVPPPGIGYKDFRDPTTGWFIEDKWYISIGSKVNKTGIALVYETTDFLKYTLLDGILHSVPTTGMWECVDFYPVSTTSENGLDTSANGPGIKHVLKASLDDTKEDYYALGTYYAANNSWIPDDPKLDVGIGIRYDYGKYYASKTFYDQNKGRRILWGWIGETISESADVQKDWAGLQNIPRVVTFDMKTKTNLIQWPVEEVESLRLVCKELENIEIEAGSVVPIDIGTATQLDITAEFNIDGQALNGLVKDDTIYSCNTSDGAAGRGSLGPFGLLVLADDGLIEQTAIYFYIGKGGDDNLQASFCADESRSSVAKDVGKFIYGSIVPVLDGEKLTMRILVDHSIVESFAQGGRTCITSRVYPTEAIYGAARLFLFNNATGIDVTLSSLKIWHMNSAFIRPYTF